MAENASSRVRRIRKRSSYREYVELFILLVTEPTLGELAAWFHSRLDKRHAYGSETNAQYAFESLQQFCADFRVDAPIKICPYDKAQEGSRQPPVTESQICNECGRSVAPGSGRFVNRVSDFSACEERVANGKPYPHGGFLCSECDLKCREGEK